MRCRHLVEAGISLRTVQDGGKPGERYLVPVRALSAGFRGRFLRMARRALTESSLPDVPGKPWVVYAKPALHGAKHVLAYLGRYGHRTALAESQLVHCNERSVALRYLDHRVRAFGLLHREKRATLQRLQLLLGAPQVAEAVARAPEACPACGGTVFTRSARLSALRCAVFERRLRGAPLPCAPPVGALQQSIAPN